MNHLIQAVGRFNSALQLIFLVLKLTGLVGWSWWWVMSPLWGACILAVLIVAGLLIHNIIQEAG